MKAKILDIVSHMIRHFRAMKKCKTRFRKNRANKLQIQANAFTHQVPLVQTLDSAIHRINHYLVDEY